MYLLSYYVTVHAWLISFISIHHLKVHNIKYLIFPFLYKKISEYDQETPQLPTADQPTTA